MAFVDEIGVLGSEVAELVLLGRLLGALAHQGEMDHIGLYNAQALILCGS